MTGTTADDRLHDLEDLLPNRSLTLVGPMACGNAARLSLDPDDPSVPEELRYLCWEWSPICKDCAADEDQDDEDQDDEDQDDEDATA